MSTETQSTCQLESSRSTISGKKNLNPVCSEYSDTQLIKRFQDGDSKVFDLLYLRYRDRVYGIIRCIISNPEDVLDLTQDVFLKAY